MNRLVCSAMVAFFPRSEDLPGLEDLDVEGQVAAFRRETTPLIWLGVFAGAMLFAVAPIATLGRPVLASALSPADLDTHTSRLATHRVYLVRQAMFLLKLMGGLFWAQSARVRSSIALPVYEHDPGTRQVERTVRVAPTLPRAPVSSLVTIGRRERELGRVHPSDHAAAKSEAG